MKLSILDLKHGNHKIKIINQILFEYNLNKYNLKMNITG